MSHAEFQFPGLPHGSQPMSKHVDFDECLKQNAAFRVRNVDIHTCSSSWMLMNVSSKMQVSGLAVWIPAMSKQLHFDECLKRNTIFALKCYQFPCVLQWFAVWDCQKPTVPMNLHSTTPQRQQELLQNYPSKETLTERGFGIQSSKSM